MAKGRGQRASAGAIAAAVAGFATGSRAAAHSPAVDARLLLRRWIEEEIEARRLFLWLPVFFGLGLLLYFAADREPALWAPATGLCAALAGVLAAQRKSAIGLKRTCMALAFLFAGFLGGCLRTHLVAAPVLERVTVARVTAFVEVLDPRTTGARLLLRPVAMDGVDRAKWPERIRVTMRWPANFESGATIAGTMRLLPPPRPAEPGGYDFSRDAWFQRIGAVGSLSSLPAIAPDAAAPLTARINATIDRARNSLTRRIIQTVGGAHGPVAAALVTGKRGEIAEETNEALRGAGIYHVVSISGLHMVLAAGLFLWSLRALLALSPALALSRPIKIWAAIFAMAGACAYDLFSGSEVATERSLVMVLILLGAVIAGRPAFSMRNLALAALLVMALEPNAILGPSFQMSFAAVAAMIAAFEKRSGGPRDALSIGAKPQEIEKDPRARWGGRVRIVLVAMVVTTLVASLATDPYATYHFHRITPYGLIGNLLTLPLVEFIVMPAAVLGVVANPFGLDGPVWWLMGQGVHAMMEVARWVASLQGSTVHIPAFGPAALLLMTIGLLWIVLWQSPLRWGGVIFAASGVWLAAATVQPDLVIDRQGRSLAYRGRDGKLAVLNGKANLFGVSQWLSADADSRKPGDPRLPGNGLCDPSGCTGILRDGRTLALVLERSALPQDCGRADIVVTPIFAQSLCKGPEFVFGGEHLAAKGATRGWIGPSGAISFQYARDEHYDRPWSPAPRRAAQQTPAVSGDGWVPAR